MSMMSDLADDVLGALDDALAEITYTPAAASTFTVKLASPATIGTTSLNLYDLGSLQKILVGDTIRVNPFTTVYRATATADPVSGAVAAAVTPAVVNAAATGSLVSVSRSAAVVVRGIILGIDLSRVSNSLISATDIRVMIRVDSLTNRPIVGDSITINGQKRIVYSVQTDAANAFHSILVK